MASVVVVVVVVAASVIVVVERRGTIGFNETEDVFVDIVRAEPCHQQFVHFDRCRHD